MSAGIANGFGTGDLRRRYGLLGKGQKAGARSDRHGRNGGGKVSADERLHGGDVEIGVIVRDAERRLFDDRHARIELELKATAGVREVRRREVLRGVRRDAWQKVGSYGEPFGMPGLMATASSMAA
jgi:hypothetical protein